MPDTEPNPGDLPLVEPQPEIDEQAQADEDSVPQEQDSVAQEQDSVAQAKDSVAQEPETPEQPGTLEQPEVHAPMIEVHEPHEAVHSWKDAFIHIAIIVVGLVIAVGLDRMVEFFHHQHQVAEMRRALEIERRININHFAMQTEEFYRFVPKLETDLAIFQFLKAHPHASPEQWPGRFSTYHLGPALTYADAAWKTAQQDNVLVLMPAAEEQQDSVLYGKLAALNDNMAAKEVAIFDGTKIWIEAPDPAQWSPEQVDREIERLSTVLSLYFEGAVGQRVLNERFPDFKPATTYEDEGRVVHSAGIPDDAKKVDEMKQRLRREDEAAAGGEQSGTP